MYNKVLIAFAFCCIFLHGCTAPSQKIAQQAMALGLEQNTKIIENYGNLTKQLIVDLQVSEVKKAVINNDQKAAQEAIEKTANMFEMCNYLDIQAERTRSVLRIAQMYIWEQQGFFNIMLDEWKAAQKVKNE